MKARAAENCTTCRGSGWYVRVDGNVETAVPCPDCRPQSRLAKLLESAQIPPRYFDRGFDVYNAAGNPLQERALCRAVDYVEAFPNVPRGLLFVGESGVGKTHLSVAILKTLIEEKAITGRFVDESELLRRLQYSYSPETPETEREVLLPLMNADLLVWDDLGVGRPTEWASETIRMVLNYRYTYNKQTILSTNLPLAPEPKRQSANSILTDRARENTLSERIGAHLFSRLMEMCEIVEIEGPDARKEIHKARLDFVAKEAEIKLPAGLVHCPKCESRQVRHQDYSKPRQSKAGRFVEISCVCESCAEYFTARFFSKTARVEYPES